MSDFNRGISTNDISAGRITAHGKVASVDEGFFITNGAPFSILVIPIASVIGRVISVSDNLGILINCKLSQSHTMSDLAVVFNQWTEGLIGYIHIDAIDLELYDVYWGAGNTMAVGNPNPFGQEWVLLTGLWNDYGWWDDTALWIDAI